MGAQGRASGQDEGGQGGQAGLRLVDGAFEAAGLGRAHGGLGLAAGKAGRGVGELRAEGEEVALDLAEEPAEPAVGFYLHHAQKRVQLVHVAIGGDPQVVLGHAGAAEEAGGAVVARLRVDLHGVRGRSSAKGRS